MTVQKVVTLVLFRGQYLFHCHGGFDSMMFTKVSREEEGKEEKKRLQ